MKQKIKLSTLREMIVNVVLEETKNKTINEGVAKNSPKIERYVNKLNDLINSAFDSDGDPIGVIEPSSTYEIEWVYKPIIYKNGALRITSYPKHKVSDISVDIINSRDMEYDGIPTLQLINRMYNKAIRRKNKDIETEY